jgi:hypothetical protein
MRIIHTHPVNHAGYYPDASQMAIKLIVDPEIFFLHGPLTALGDSFCQDIQATVENLSPKLLGTNIKIVPSTLGDDAGALGAGSLAMETWDPAAK